MQCVLWVQSLMCPLHCIVVSVPWDGDIKGLDCMIWYRTKLRNDKRTAQIKLSTDKTQHVLPLQLWNVYSEYKSNGFLIDIPRLQGSWVQYGVHLGPTGPRWAPCLPHALCYLGCDPFTKDIFPFTIKWDGKWLCYFEQQITLKIGTCHDAIATCTNIFQTNMYNYETIYF